jgi:hypothetical protein
MSWEAAERDLATVAAI